MNKKLSLGLCLTLIILTVAGTFTVTMQISKRIFNGMMSDVSARSKTYDSIDEVSKLVSNYFYGDTGNSDTLNAALAGGYVASLNDSASEYLTAAEYSELNSKIENKDTGCGLETFFDKTQGKLTVAYVYPGSPAANSEIKQGDIIEKINGETVNQVNCKSLCDSFYTADSVTVDFVRNEESLSRQMACNFVLPSCQGAVLSGNVGYIKFSGFFKNTASDFSALIASLQEKGATKFIFDVRSVNLGSIDYAVKVVDVICPAVSGSLALAKDKTGGTYKNKVYTADTAAVSGEFCVLVNSVTAGPAELFACDLSEICSATLVGTKTAGVGTMQEYFTLENGDVLKLTVALVVPYAGESAVYNKTGLVPNEEVSLTGISSDEMSISNLENDNQVTYALTMLSQTD